MIEFKSLTIDDYSIFRKYLEINKYPNSEYNFSTTFAWHISYQTRYAIVNDCLCIKAINPMGFDHVSFPLGHKENIKNAIEQLTNYFSEINKPLVLMSLSQGMISCLQDLELYDLFDYEPRRDFYDYIYKRDKLVSLSGKKLHGKRNHYNYFENNYSYALKEITDENIEDCRKKLKEIIIERSADPQEELNATMMALEYRDKLYLTGRALYVEGELVGVILGENHHGVALIQIAKTDIKYRGASVALFKLFLENFFTDCEYVNFMEDLGMEGLRKAKLSYDPDFFVEKSIARMKQ